MSKRNWLVKKVNLSKFNYYTTYALIHSESYNLFEQVFIRKTLRNNSPKAKFAIDIGCGPGLVLKEMHYFYEHSVGVDISPGILRDAKDYLTYDEKRNIDLLCADVEFMPFKDATFDVAVMYSVLHHLPNLYGSLREANRAMTQKSSLIMFHEPNELRWRHVSEKTLVRILEKTRFIFLQILHRGKWQRFNQEAQFRFSKMSRLEDLADIHAAKGFGIKEMETLLERCGFEVTEIKPRIQAFTATFSLLMWPFKLIAALDLVLTSLPILSKHLPVLFCVAKKKPNQT